LNSLVSVMMPCYNAAVTLPLALASLRVQTHENWECILVDDGSTDDPRAVVEAFGDSRIRFFRLPENRGRGVARQLALEQARGQLLGFLDADDWYYPDKLARQVELMEGTSRLGVVSSCVGVVDERNNLLGIRPRAALRGGPIRRFDRLAPPPFPFAPSCVRMELAKSQCFDAALLRSQDTDFMLRVLRGATYMLEPVVTYAYLEPPASYERKLWSSAGYTTRLYWKHRRTDPLAAGLQSMRVLVRAAASHTLHRFGLARPLAARRSRAPSPVEADRHRNGLHAVSACARAVAPSLTHREPAIVSGLAGA